MANRRVDAFVEYVLPGVYDHRPDQKKLVLSLGRRALLNVLGSERLGSAQKEELKSACSNHGIGLLDAGDEFLFFSLEDIKRTTAKLDGVGQALKSATDHFAKLIGSEAAEEEYTKYEFPEPLERRV